MLKLSNLFEKYLIWWVLGLFIFIPLYPKFPLFNVPGTYVAIRMEDFLIALITIWWLIAICPRINEFLDKTLTKAVLLFWGIGLLSLFSGIFLTQTVSWHLGLFHWLRRVETMLLLFIAIDAFRSQKGFRFWLKVMLGVIMAVVIYGFGQQYLKFPVISTTNREFSKGLILFLSPEARVNSTFAGHYDLAVFLTFVLTMLAGFFIYFKKFYTKVFIAVIAFFSFILLAMTAARVSFFAVLAGITSVFWLSSQKKLILVLVFFAGLAFVISPDLRHRTVATLTVNLLGGGGAKYTPPVQKASPTGHFSVENAAVGEATPAGVPVDIAPGEPINTTELGVYRSFGIRIDEEWPRAIRAFEKNPILGTGYSSITIATDNDYLRSLGETGILGTLSLILIFWIILKSYVRVMCSRQRGLVFYTITGLTCGLITIFITSLFIDVLESSKVAQLLWLSLGVGMATLEMENNDG